MSNAARIAELLSSSTALIPSAPIYLTAASGTYTPSAGARAARFHLVGGGSAGGGNTAANSGEGCAGTGGGAGSEAIKFISSLAASYAYTVGAAGLGVSGAAGQNGGNTTIAGVTAGGGVGGALGLSAGSARVDVGSAGGTASGGEINKGGAPGGPNFRANTIGCSGFGGSSTLGGGGAARSSTTASQSLVGNSATGYGAAGGGSVAFSGGAANKGGDGAPGVIVVTEFF